MPNEIFKVFKTKKYGQVTPPTYHNYAPQNMKDRLLALKVDDILLLRWLLLNPGFFFLSGVAPAKFQQQLPLRE